MASLSLASATVANSADSVGKHVFKSKLEESVFKATQSKGEPSKPKHERAIILETWNAHGAAVVWQELSKRPLASKALVLFKVRSIAEFFAYFMI